MNEHNPYQSPSSPDVFTKPLFRQFPWRVIPVVVLHIYGGLAVLSSGVTVFAILCGGSLCTDHHFATDAQAYVIMFAWVLIGVYGCLLIAAARSVWRRCWKRSVVAIGAAVLLAAVVPLIGYIVSKMPPGRRWPPPSHTTAERVTNQQSQETNRSITLTPRAVSPRLSSNPQSPIPNPSPYAVIPFVSAMNAVSRFNSSSRNSCSLKPASINSVGRSL